MNEILYCVVVDAGGAHEAECAYSIWESESAALLEAKRLNESGQSLGCYGGFAYVAPTKINKPSNEWIQ